MRKFGLAVALASAALALGGCVHLTEAQCDKAIEKVQDARAKAQLAQTAVAAACSVGVASKACTAEQRGFLLAHAALDAAVAAATQFCPSLSAGAAPPPSLPPAPPGKTI